MFSEYFLFHYPQVSQHVYFLTPQLNKPEDYGNINIFFKALVTDRQAVMSCVCGLRITKINLTELKFDNNLYNHIA